MAKLNSQAPDEDDGRSQLDQAVNPERGEGKATGTDAEAICHRRFDRHPGKRDVLEPERLSDHRSPVISHFGGASGTHVRNCTSTSIVPEPADGPRLDLLFAE